MAAADPNHLFLALLLQLQQQQQQQQLQQQLQQELQQQLQQPASHSETVTTPVTPFKPSVDADDQPQAAKKRKSSFHSKLDIVSPDCFSLNFDHSMC
jgi:type II secretory pathway pseudopilin PulG